VIHAFLYDANGIDREIDVASIDLNTLGEDQLLWLDVVGRDERELRNLQSLLGLKPQAVSDLLRFETAVVLNNYGQYFHCTVMSPGKQQSVEARLPTSSETVRFDLLVGEKWLLTVEDRELIFLTDFRKQDRSETLIGVLTPASLAASLLDWHLTTFFTGIERLETFLDSLDVRLLGGRPINEGRLKEIVSARRYIGFLRRLLSPQRSVFYGLSRPDFTLVAGSEAAEPFRALERRFERASSSIEHGHELVQGSFDLLTARLSESTNVLIRRLTFLSLMLGGISAVAGIFGMNFETVYTQSGERGFWLVVGTLLAISLISLVVSRLRRWI
jgi:Mg2+ and Co2+ transporter CorA